MTEDKGTATSDKSAATGAAPVSDKKAADTSEAYQKAAGLESEPASDSDPVMDSINEATADIEQPKPQTAIINQEYEKQRAEAFDNRKTSEDEDDEEDDGTTEPDVNYSEIGSQPNVVEDDSDAIGLVEAAGAEAAWANAPTLTAEARIAARMVFMEFPCVGG